MNSGAKRALAIFHNAARRVKAYKYFLKDHKVVPAEIKTPEDFLAKVPVMDKLSYLKNYDFPDLFSENATPPMIYASSGSSGRPTFWGRGDEQEETGGRIHKTIFHEIFGIEKSDRTLVIICFSMGIWVAGGYTLSACRFLSRQGFQISSITPGIEKEDVFRVLKDLAPNFKHIVLAGYPPFIMDVAKEVLKKGVRIKNQLKVLTAGDQFSEQWRDELSVLLKLGSPLDSIVNIYGSADAGILGHETPLSIYIRRKCAKNKALYRAIFGDESPMPVLFQYHPEEIFFEQLGKELIFTVNTAAPLIRYNIHDLGKVFPYDQMKEALRKNGLASSHSELRRYGDWRLPFIVKAGRSDVAVTFYALNIFPEHIRAGIEDKKIAKYLSGNFMAYNRTLGHQKSQKWYIKLELAAGVRLSKKILRLAQTSLTRHLLALNMEFRKLYLTLGAKALPVLAFTPFGQQAFVSRSKNSSTALINIKGKKPKLFDIAN